MTLPCGCRRCGCMCDQHSPSRQTERCLACALASLAEEAGALIALALFLACLTTWCAILA